MSEFLAQLRMELRQQATRPFVWFCLAASFALAFGATLENGFGARGYSWVNGGDAIATRAMLLSVLGIIAIAGIIGEAMSRDRPLQTEETLLMSGTSAAVIGLGRFIIGFALVLIIGAMLVPGMVLGSLLPGIPAERLGPTLLSHYGKALAFYIVPNFLLVSALIYAVAGRWRNQTGAFVVALGLIALYATALMMVGREAYRHEVFPLYALLDPFGTIASAEHAMTWTVAQNNMLFRPLDGLLLRNRLLWMTVAVGLVILGTIGLPNRLRPARAARRARRQARRRPGMDNIPLRMIGWEIRALLRQPGVLLMLGFSAFSLWWAAASSVAYSFSLPTTDLLTHNTGFYFDKVLILLIVWSSGEIIWRERINNIDALTDTAPDSDLWRLVAKTTALVLIALCFWALSVAVNLTYQLAQGFTDFDLWLHLTDTFLFKAPYYIWLALIAIAAQVILRQRYIAMAAVLLIYLSESLFDAFGLTHPIYRFGDTGFFWFSAMDGYGHFARGHLWMTLFWTLVCLLIWGLGWAMTGRGRLPARRRLLLRHRLGRGAPVFLSLAGAILLTGGWIIYQTTFQHRWPLFDMNAAMAEMERDLRLDWANIPQPVITGITGQIDLYPGSRHVDMRGTLTLTNQTDQPVDELLILFYPQLTRQEVNPGNTARRIDTALPPNVQHWQLARALPPGANIELSFRTAQTPGPGFALHNAHDLIAEVGAVEVIGNGTSFMNLNLMPAIGYSARLEHKPGWLRKRYGLDPDWAPSASSINAATPHDTTHLGWVTNMDITITTSADQTPLFPGRIVSDDHMPDGRRRTRFVAHNPARGWGEVMSARYASFTAERPDLPGVALYHHPRHNYNLPAFSTALLDAIAHFQARYGPPPFSTFRVAETALHNDGFGQRGGLAYVSEILTWKSDQRWTKGDDLLRDAANLVALAWWSDQIMPANLPGAKALWSGLPYWSAALYQHQTRGPDASRTSRLNAMLDMYRARAGLEDAETPFAQEMKNSAMIRKKGVLQIIYLAELAGPERLEAAFATFLDRWRFAGPPYPSAQDLWTHLKAELPVRAHPALDDLFAHVSNWRLTTQHAETWQLPDGRWELRAVVTARKLRTSGLGEETEVPLTAPLPLAAFSGATFGPDDTLHTAWRTLTSGETRLRMVLPTRPERFGIDPWLYLPDPNPQDNVIRVDVLDSPPDDA